MSFLETLFLKLWLESIIFFLRIGCFFLDLEAMMRRRVIRSR